MSNEVVIVVKSRNETKGGFDEVRRDAERAGNDSGDGFHKGFASKIGKIGDDVGPKLSNGIGQSLSKNFTGVTAKLTSSLSGAFSEAGSAAGPLLAAGIVAVSPVIGAALSGAVIGGAAGIGIIGGLLLVKDDPRVQAAGQGLASKLLGSLKADATPFIAPVIAAVGLIGDAFDKIEPHIQSIFSTASRFIGPLVQGLTGFLDPVIAGLDHLTAAAGPVIQSIKSGFTEVGEALGEVFDSLSDNGGEAAAALSIVFHALAETIKIVGAIVNGLTEAFGVLADVAAAFGFDSAKKKIDEFKASSDMATTSATGLGQATQDLSDKSVSAAAGVGAAQAATALAATTFDTATFAASAVADAMKVAASQARGLGNANHSLYDSETNVQAALDDVTTSIKKNGTSLDSHTIKGRANRTAMSNLASALNANYDAYVKVNGEGPKADKVSRDNYTAFLKAAHGAGIGASAARDLAVQLGLIPAKKATKVDAQTAAAKAAIRALQIAVNALHGKTIQVTVHRVITGGSLSGSVHVSGPGGSGTLTKAHGGVVGRAASGGQRDGLTLVGEEGPELVDLPAGSAVHTAGDSRRMMGGGGSGDVYLTYVPSGNTGMDAFITNEVLPRLQKTNRTRYGNSATLMLKG